MKSITKEPTYALEAELGYIQRSISWTFSRAEREGTNVDIKSMQGVLDREKAIKEELERRKKVI